MREIVRQIYDVNVFFDKYTTGNSALCFIVEKDADAEIFAGLSAQENKTCCFIWQNDAVNVRCYKGGDAIDLCGHGLLAAAQVWKHLTATPSPAIPRIILHAGTTQAMAEWRNKQLWLSLPRIRCREIALPNDIASGFDPPPSRAALAGGEHGYKIFVWPGGTDIALVRVNHARIAADRRATILTQADASSQWSFTLRYIAPQYDADEDQATGSATAVLADYWTQYGMRAPFSALQRSSGGGVIFSDVDGDKVFLSGNAAINSVGENYVHQYG